MILKNTRCYLAGPIQYKDGTEWRAHMEMFLEAFGVLVLNPQKLMFEDDLEGEIEELHKKMKDFLEEGEYDRVAEIMRHIRVRDLRAIDIVDFLVVYIDTSVHTCGTYEELFIANKQKKPIFIVMEGGKQKTPYWLLGTVPHELIFDSFFDLKRFIGNIDSGAEKVGGDRWKILRKRLL